MEQRLDSYDTVKLIGELSPNKKFELKGFVYFTAWSTSTFSYADSSLLYENIRILVPSRKKLTVMNLSGSGSCKLLSCRMVLTEKHIFREGNYKLPKSKRLRYTPNVEEEMKFQIEFVSNSESNIIF